MGKNKKRLRLLLAGHRELGSNALAGILGSGFEATYVSEQSPTLGRGETLQSVGDKFGVVPIDDFGEIPLEAAIRAYRPDILLSCGYWRIIAKSVLNSVEYPINVHFGALPRYRGCWSVPQAILNGDSQIGVTLHSMNPGIDDGPIYGQTMVADDGTLSCKDLYLQAVQAGVDLILKFLDQVSIGIIPVPSPQDEANATYFGLKYPNDFRIDWRATTLQVSRYIRASYFPPYSPAYTQIDSIQQIYVHWPVGTVIELHGIATGTVVELPDGEFGVAVLNGFIVPSLINLDGQKSKPFSEFVVERNWIGRRLGNLVKGIRTFPTQRFESAVNAVSL
jgi:methionyl-tRNA formyltransferase